MHCRIGRAERPAGGEGQGLCGVRDPPACAGVVRGGPPDLAGARRLELDQSINNRINRATSISSLVGHHSYVCLGGSSASIRERSRACLIRRETCICETPIRSAISAW